MPRFLLFPLILLVPVSSLFARSDFLRSSLDPTAPSPDLPTNEITVGEWRVLSRTAIGNGLEDISIAPSVENTNIGQFSSVTVRITGQPEGVEVIDGESTVGAEGSKDIVLAPEASVEISDGIVLRMLTTDIGAEGSFLASLSADPYAFATTARELPLLAEGVFVIENFSPSIVDTEQENVYAFQIVGTDWSGHVNDPDVMAAQQLAEDRAADFMNDLLTQENGDPLYGTIAISDPVRRAQVGEGIYPPVDWLPNRVSISGPIPYSMQSFGSNPNVRSGFEYFTVSFDLNDTGALFVDPRAFAQTGTFVGGYGTPTPPTGAPDTEGDTQDDILSVGSEEFGVIEPKHYSIRRREIYDEVFFSGQMSMSGVTGSMLLRLRKDEAPYFSASLETQYSAAFRIWTKRHFELEERKIQLSPETPIPLASFPVGPIECRITMSPLLLAGMKGELDGSAVVGWKGSQTSKLEWLIEDGESTLDLVHETVPNQRTGPFWDGEVTGQFDAFARAELGLDLTFSGLAGITLDAEADAFVRFNVDSREDPWWSITPGKSSSAVLAGNVLGIPFAEKDVDISETLQNGLSQVADLLPDPDGKPNASESHWAKALTYDTYSVLRNADVEPLANGGLLLAAQYGTLDLLIVELDLEGNEVLRKGLTGLGVAAFKAIHPLSSGGAIVLADKYLVRLDASYDVVWKKTIAPSTGTLLKIVSMDVGEDEGDFWVYLAGDVSGTNWPNRQGTVIKIDSSGAIVWSKTYASSGNERFTSVQVGPDGACIAVGQTDAAWDDNRSPDVGPYPDSVQNGYLVRINADGTSPWAWAATPTEFVDVAVHSNGLIGAASGRHGVPDPWRGPGLHVFSWEGEFLYGSTYAINLIGEGITKGDSISDTVVDVVAAPQGGFVLASKTGIHPEATSASHLINVSPGGGVDWAVVYDWTDSPQEVPVRIIDRGDSFLYMAELKEAQFNGGDPIDALFLSCIPDIGMLQLLPANRLDIHDFYEPVIDNYSGRGVAGVSIVGVPKSYEPVVSDIEGIASTDLALNLNDLDTEFELIVLSDSVPPKPIPTVDPKPGPTGRSFRFSWANSARGYRLFESDDLRIWRPSPLRIDEEGEKKMVDVMLDIEGAKPFYRLEQTEPSE